MHSLGEIVGDTSNRKVVYAYLISEKRIFPHSTTKEFSLRDHYDAYCIFAHLTTKEKDRNGENSERYDLYTAHANEHLIVLQSKKELEVHRKEAGERDAFGDKRRGRRLCRLEFRI